MWNYDTTGPVPFFGQGQASEQELVKDHEGHAGDAAEAGDHEAQVRRLHGEAEEAAAHVVHRVEDQDARGGMDEELQRIEEEIRKAKEKRQALEDRRTRKLREIRAKQERDRAAWLRKMSAVLDRTLTDMKGKLYFSEVTQDQVADAVRRAGILPEVKKPEADKKSADTGSRKGDAEG